MSTLTNAYAKEISALKLKKYRESHRKFVVEGPNLVVEALQQDLYTVESVIGTDTLFDNLNVEIDPGVEKYVVSERILKKISALKTPYDGLAVLKYNESRTQINESLLFYMDEIQDPGNLGTIIRSAEWFGIRHLLMGKGTVDPYNPKCIRASMGSLFRIKISTISALNLKDLSNNYIICGADLTGTSIQDYDLSQNTIIVIGNEGRGITQSTEPYIQNRISIPASKTNQSDSLNAGISASIIMYEMSIKKAGK